MLIVVPGRAARRYQLLCDTDHSYYGDFRSGGGTPALYVTVLPAADPIPEPAGWAVLGLAYLGFRLPREGGGL